MKTTRLIAALLALAVIGAMAGCKPSTKSPDVSQAILKSLDQAGLKDVTVTQDTDKGIVTLGGQVATEDQKAQAELLAKRIAGTEVVANQIAVIPAGGANDVHAVNSDLDQGIEKNLDAALIQNKMKDLVNVSVKNGVVTLSGEVSSEDLRTNLEKLATGVPNVKQVVNAVSVVKHRKATSAQ
ncbi:MAG: BON domain-containing protein [Terracidiphilus sp.]